MVENYNNFIVKSVKNKRNNDIPFIAEVTQFALQQLFKNKTPKHKFELEINLVDTMPVDNELVELRGYCEDYDLPSKKKYFKIKVLQTLQINELIDTLVHELVHLYQTAMGQLVIDNKTGWKWKSKKFGLEPYVTEDDYFNLPWELDADSKQRTLCKKFYNEYYKNW